MTAPGHADHAVSRGQRRRDVVEHVRRVAQAREEQERPARPAPIEHLEPYALFHLDERGLVRGLVAPLRRLRPRRRGRREHQARQHAPPTCDWGPHRATAPWVPMIRRRALMAPARSGTAVNVVIGQKTTLGMSKTAPSTPASPSSTSTASPRSASSALVAAPRAGDRLTSVKPVKKAPLHQTTESQTQLTGLPSRAVNMATGAKPKNASEPNCRQPRAATPILAAGEVASARPQSAVAVVRTCHQTHAAPRVPRASTKSPVMASAHSGEVKRASSRWAIGSLDTDTSRKVESIEQALVRLQRTRERLLPQWRHRDVPFRAAAPLRRGIAHSGRDGALGFEPFQRRVQRTWRHLPSPALRELGADGHAIRALAQAQDGEKDELLEFAEIQCRRHLDCIVVN